MRLAVVVVVVAGVGSLASCIDIGALLGGGECSSDTDCHGSKICVSGACVECENDRDCDPGHVCTDNECVRATAEGEGDVGEGEGEGEGDVGPGEGEGEGDIGPGEGEGEGEGEPQSCGAVPTTGQCVGSTLEICDANNTLQTVDCTDTTAFDAGTVCARVNAEAGFTCLLPVGAACFFQDSSDPSGNTVFTLACQGGAHAGCEVNAAGNGTACNGNAGINCSQADATSTTGRCADNKLIFGCGFAAAGASDGQALYFDCDNVGGTCDATTSATNTGCFLASPGAACIAGFTFCGADPNTAVACPASGTCP